MRNIFIISDTHFSHNNILKFTGDDDKLIRPEFSSVEEMDEIMIQNWNDTIKENDIVYHNGDVIFNNQVDSDKLLSRLNGKKRLILGNHDILHQNKSLLKHFKKINMWRYFHEFDFILSHVPMHVSSFDYKKSVNVHGHIHEKNSPKGPYINVCVEKINYSPVNIEDLMVEIKKKKTEYYD